MNARTTNVSILALLSLELVTGLGSFLVGSEGGRWVFWLHGIAGFSLAALGLWKWRIIARSFRRRGSGLWAFAPVALGVVFAGALGTGVYWVLVGRGSIEIPLYGTMRPLVLHTILGLAIAAPLTLHAAVRWSRPRGTDFTSRRNALRLIGVAAAGAGLWAAAGAASGVGGGTPRRFTGSREEASRLGNRHPTTQWLFDSRQRIAADAYRLRVTGKVGTPLELSYSALLGLAEESATATLDCTGGWYTVQQWSGIPLWELLERANVAEGAASVRIVGATGYDRRFSLAEAERLLLATHVEDERLSSGHGFPVRLVAPGKRGYHWVKWVTEVEVSGRPSWRQPPLPLQ